MPLKLELAGSQAVVTLEDALTLRHADEIRKVLIKALIDADEVAITFRNVTDVDLSCLQLLCSAHRSAVRFNKRLSLAGSTPPIFQRSMEAAGYSRLTGCGFDQDRT
jgi:anti-anti-sigma regulatory factor